MLRGIHWSAALIATLMITTGCKTTSGSVANVDKARGEVYLYSSGDARTSLEDKKKQSDIRETEARLKQHLRSHRNDVEAVLALAEVQVSLDELEAAEKNCHTALRQDLKNREARKILAEIAMRRGNHDMASIYLANIGGANSKDSAVLNMLAQIELGKGNNSGAMALFKRAIKANGNDLAARMNLGVLLLKYRQLDQAAVEFERVLKAAPAHSDAKLHLAIVKGARGQAEDAQNLLEEVLKEDENNPLALYNLAVVQRNRENFDDAMENLKAYLKSTRGKANDNDQVFALIDDIQKHQAAKGERVSDDDIQAMALAAKTAPKSEPKAKVAKNDDGAKPKATAPAAPKAKPAKKAQPAAMPLPEDDGSGTGGNDEISELEKALK